MKRYLVGSVAAALVLGAFAGAQIASTAAAPQEESVFTPIVPCRAMDTRPDTKIGSNDTFGPGTVRILGLWGETGECNLPSNTTAIAMNVTVVGGTSPSFLTIWPSDAAERPTASNLNWFGGEAPLPNKVDVALSSKGKIRMFNLAGTVDVIADVAGYYSPAKNVLGSGIGTVTVLSADIVIEPTSTPGDTGSNGQATVMCPSGQVAISGGVEAPLSIPFNVRSSRSHPAGADNPTGWYGDVRSADDDPATLAATPTVYVMCVTP